MIVRYQSSTDGRHMWWFHHYRRRYRPLLQLTELNCMWTCAFYNLTYMGRVAVSIRIGHCPKCNVNRTYKSWFAATETKKCNGKKQREQLWQRSSWASGKLSEALVQSLSFSPPSPPLSFRPLPSHPSSPSPPFFPSPSPHLFEAS